MSPSWRPRRNESGGGSQLLGWTPTGPTLLEDLASGSYFRA